MRPAPPAPPNNPVPSQNLEKASTEQCRLTAWFPTPRDPQPPPQTHLPGFETVDAGVNVDRVGAKDRKHPHVHHVRRA